MLFIHWDDNPSYIFIFVGGGRERNKITNRTMLHPIPILVGELDELIGLCLVFVPDWAGGRRPWTTLESSCNFRGSKFAWQWSFLMSKVPTSPQMSSQLKNVWPTKIKPLNPAAKSNNMSSNIPSSHIEPVLVPPESNRIEFHFDLCSPWPVNLFYLCVNLCRLLFLTAFGLSHPFTSRPMDSMRLFALFL